MHMDGLNRAKSRNIAYYVCSGDSISGPYEGNYEERYQQFADNYSDCCKQFADKICDAAIHYTRLNESDKTILIEEFTAALTEIIEETNIIYCELGMKIGFTMAFDLGLAGIKERKVAN